jgi:DNA primase
MSALLFSPAELEDARTRWDIITADVPMKRKGRELAGCCPFHAEQTPSFYVAPDKGFFHCFGCGAHGTVVDYVMRQRNLEFIEAVREILGKPQQRPREAAPIDRGRDRDDEDHREVIRRILEGCTPVAERTAAHLYLWSRGLPTRQPGLLAHPALECWELGRDESGAVRRLPALVAPIITSAHEITALLRIWVVDRFEAGAVKDARAPLRTRKKGVGVMGDGAIRLTPIEELGNALGWAEGPETACAARKLFRVPTWAASGTARFGFPGHWRQRVTPAGQRPTLWVPPDKPPAHADAVWVEERPPTLWIPPSIDRLIVFGDNGATGHIVADYAAAFWRRQGLDAEAVYPPPQFGDFNDQVLG